MNIERYIHTTHNAFPFRFPSSTKKPTLNCVENAFEMDEIKYIWTFNRMNIGLNWGKKFWRMFLESFELHVEERERMD